MLFLALTLMIARPKWGYSFIGRKIKLETELKTQVPRRPDFYHVFFRAPKLMFLLGLLNNVMEKSSEMRSKIDHS